MVSGVRDDQLDYPTPCPDWTVADLRTHVHQFATAFTHNARKRQARPPEDLVDDWRVAIPDQLDELACAWRVDSAWQGRVSVGGVEMDAQDNAVVRIEAGSRRNLAAFIRRALAATGLAAIANGVALSSQSPVRE